MEKSPEHLILLIDDEVICHDYFQRLFRNHPLRLHVAYDYADARKAIERFKRQIALAIVDLRLPNSWNEENFDGIKLLNEFRERGIYAIVISHYFHNLEETLAQRPEVRETIDKKHFNEEAYQPILLAKIFDAIEYGMADRWAEGTMPEQKDRLDSLNGPDSLDTPDR